MESEHFRDFSEFCQQLNDIKQKFHKWDSCEKTVALYYLMVGLPFGNAKFLQHALEQCILAVDSSETRLMEQNANDSKVILNFLLEQPNITLSLLLAHLPLLRPGNKDTAKCYLRVIRQILLQFITPPLKIYNECVEIMSYVYIHPAFCNEDKRSFRNLLKQVLNKVSPDNFIRSSVTESSDESVSPNPDSKDNIKRLNRRSNSLTPQEIANPRPPAKPRSYSLCTDKLLSSGINNLKESKSETRLQDLILMNNLPAMKSIVSWLKSLRLHKYSWVFNNITYNHMVNLTDETLQAIGITKGARHKLLLSIAKLKDRSAMLTELEAEVMNGGDINNAMKKLKVVLQTPLEISMDDEDLPSQFVKLMGKVCTQLLMLRQPSDEYLMLFSSLCERAESTDSFSVDQKKRLNVWKSQLLKKEDPVPGLNFSQHCSPRDLCILKDNRYGNQQNVGTNQSCYTKKSSSFPNMKNNVASLKTHRHSVGSVSLQNQLYSMPQSQFFLKHNEFQEPNGFLQVSETFPNKHSVHFQDFQKDPESRNNIDIETSLESLCIQMMEHALGP